MTATAPSALDPAGMEVDHAARVLDPRPMALEMGALRLPSGVLHVAARTVMPACSGEMFEWWFRSAPDTERYAWWHPLDHGSSRWVETSPQTHVGSTHIVEERLGEGTPMQELHIHFVEAGELLGADAVAAAREAGDVSGIVAAQTGMGSDVPRDERGRPNSGRMCHVARDTGTGMVLRSRFWLGAGTGLPREALLDMIPDEVGPSLMQHAFSEFTFLARVLPSIYQAAERERVRIEYPW